MLKPLNKKGFTLVEMLVVMAVFVAILAITGDSFKTVLQQSTRLFRSEESNIEGIVGLEMLRHDIQQAGFGLFTETSPVSYLEAPSDPAMAYNDATTGAPRPLLAGNIGSGVASSDDSGINYSLLDQSDYLVIKGTTVGRSQVAQKWTYLRYSSNDVSPHRWRSNAENLSGGDKVVLLRRQIASSSQTANLTTDASGSAAQSFYFAYSNSAFSSFTSSGAAIYHVYGVNNNDLRMPFNRTDYFVARPADTSQIPQVCSDRTGILYKATLNHNDGRFNYVPMLDCVANMQVVLGWDMNGDGQVDCYSNADWTVISPAAACGATNPLSVGQNASATSTPSIRNNLKMVKVYILAQDGRKDPNYTSPSPIVVGDVGETTLTRSFALYPDMLNYRWKLYRIVARPKNLFSNQ